MSLQNMAYKEKSGEEKCKCVCVCVYRDLNVALEKEGEGLVGNRGLVTSYPDNKRLNENQLFRVYVTEEIRRQYEAKMLRQVEMVSPL